MKVLSLEDVREFYRDCRKQDEASDQKGRVSTDSREEADQDLGGV